MFSEHELKKIRPRLPGYKSGTDITQLFFGFVKKVEGDVGELRIKEPESRRYFSMNVSAEYLQQRGLSDSGGDNLFAGVEYTDVSHRKRLELVKLTED